MSNNRAFSNEIELEFSELTEKNFVRNKILFLTAHGIKMTEMEPGMFR